MAGESRVGDRGTTRGRGGPRARRGSGLPGAGRSGAAACPSREQHEQEQGGPPKRARRPTTCRMRATAGSGPSPRRRGVCASVRNGANGPGRPSARVTGRASIVTTGAGAAPGAPRPGSPRPRPGRPDARRAGAGRGPSGRPSRGRSGERPARGRPPPSAPAARGGRSRRGRRGPRRRGTMGSRGMPLTSVPFVLPMSSTWRRPPRRKTRPWRADTNEKGSTTSLSSRRPSTAAGFGTSCRRSGPSPRG